MTRLESGAVIDRGGIRGTLGVLLGGVGNQMPSPGQTLEWYHEQGYCPFTLLHGPSPSLIEVVMMFNRVRD